jgi:hypothetical protein
MVLPMTMMMMMTMLTMMTISMMTMTMMTISMMTTMMTMTTMLTMMTISMMTMTMLTMLTISMMTMTMMTISMMTTMMTMMEVVLTLMAFRQYRKSLKLTQANSTTSRNVLPSHPIATTWIDPFPVKYQTSCVDLPTSRRVRMFPRPDQLHSSWEHYSLHVLIHIAITI